jgi:hypothetical protein
MTTKHIGTAAETEMLRIDNEFQDAQDKVGLRDQLAAQEAKATETLMTPEEMGATLAMHTKAGELALGHWANDEVTLGDLTINSQTLLLDKLEAQNVNPLIDVTGNEPIVDLSDDGSTVLSKKPFSMSDAHRAVEADARAGLVDYHSVSSDGR